MRQLIALTPIKRGMMADKMKWKVQTLCLGMRSEPSWYATEEEAREEEREIRRIPGMIPLVEYDPENAPE